MKMQFQANLRLTYYGPPVNGDTSQTTGDNRSSEAIQDSFEKFHLDLHNLRAYDGFRAAEFDLRRYDRSPSVDWPSGHRCR